MDKYGALNIQATLKEDEPVALNDFGMEKQDSVSDTSSEVKNSKDECPK